MWLLAMYFQQLIMSLDKMAPVTACLATILDRNYRYAKLSILNLLKNWDMPKLHIEYTGEEKEHAKDSIGAYR